MFHYFQMYVKFITCRSKISSNWGVIFFFMNNLVIIYFTKNFDIYGNFIELGSHVFFFKTNLVIIYFTKNFDVYEISR